MNNISDSHNYEFYLNKDYGHKKTCTWQVLKRMIIFVFVSSLMEQLHLSILRGRKNCFKFYISCICKFFSFSHHSTTIHVAVKVLHQMDIQIIAFDTKCHYLQKFCFIFQQKMPFAISKTPSISYD